MAPYTHSNGAYYSCAGDLSLTGAWTHATDSKKVATILTGPDGTAVVTPKRIVGHSSLILTGAAMKYNTITATTLKWNKDLIMDTLYHSAPISG